MSLVISLPPIGKTSTETGKLFSYTAIETVSSLEVFNILQDSEQIGDERVDN